MLKSFLGPPPKASSEAVSRLMKGNKAEDTSPELLLRSALRNEGVRGYRLHRKDLPGRPDIVFPRSKVAIFVNGCFWHRCPSCRLPVPSTNRDYWRRKFELNAERDKKKRRQLEMLGWTVMTIWECEIRKDPSSSVEKVKNLLERTEAL